MTLAEQIALWADTLRDLAANGLRYTPGVHDRENYRTIQNLAMQMAALATGTTMEVLEPLRETIFSHGTPFSICVGGVINTAGEILLIRRADNGGWALPAGGAMVGETAAAGAVREVYEETGMRCQAVTLAGLYDSRLVELGTANHLYMFTFLCEPVDDGPTEPAPHAGVEVLASGWFTEDALPDGLLRGYDAMIPALYRAWRGEERAHFDA